MRKHITCQSWLDVSTRRKEKNLLKRVSIFSEFDEWFVTTLHAAGDTAHRQTLTYTFSPSLHAGAARRARGRWTGVLGQPRGACHRTAQTIRMCRVEHTSMDSLVAAILSACLAPARCPHRGQDESQPGSGQTMTPPPQRRAAERGRGSGQQ
jgi:hypothetical protein